MGLVITRARYANRALWLDEPLDIPENATVEVSIWLPAGTRAPSGEPLQKLQAWLGSIKGVSVPLEAIRRETI